LFGIGKEFVSLYPIFDFSFLKHTVMQVLRQTVNVSDNFLQVVLPADFKADRVEIIVYPVEDRIYGGKAKNSARFSGAISKATARKLHTHLNEVRREWERDIC